MTYMKEWKTMKVTIDVHLIINGTKSFTGAYFNVRKEEDIPKVAYDWIMRIRMETGYFGNQSIIEKVIYNGDKDITGKVKEIDETPIPEWPFNW